MQTPKHVYTHMQIQSFYEEFIQIHLSFYPPTAADIRTNAHSLHKKEQFNLNGRDPDIKSLFGG